MSGLFCIADFSKMGDKKNFFNFMVLNLPPSQNEVKYSYNKC